MIKFYYSTCKQCEHNYHCFGREIAEKIINGNVESLYLLPGKCDDYYPEVKQTNSV